MKSIDFLTNLYMQLKHYDEGVLDHNESLKSINLLFSNKILNKKLGKKKARFIL